MKIEKTLPVSCNRDCGAGCALTAHIEEGKIVKITDSLSRLTHMKGCIKGYRAAETLYHHERLTAPLIRTGKRGSAQFRKATWEEALDLISKKLSELKSKNNCSSLMRIGGSGACRGSLHNTDLVTQRFLSLFGNYTETQGNFSSEASTFVKEPIFGTRNVGIDAETLLSSRKIILWGFNPSDTRFDCSAESILKEASQMGIPITVIDPRKTRTVKDLKAQWISLKPGTDSAFMLAVLWLLIDSKRINRKFIAKYSIGFENIENYILGISDGIEKTPQWAAGICGLTEKTIIDFTDDYADSPVTALLPGLSLQRAVGGENADRLGAVLQLATGNTGRTGGSTGSSNWNRLEKPVLGKLTVPDNKEINGVPVYLWADAVLEGKNGGYPSDISFLYNVGGNYIGQGSDTAKTIKAFEKVEFSVTHDYFMTRTASYSDVILPVTTFLEREDIINAPNNFVFYSAKAADPIGLSKNDFEIFSILAEKLGFGDLYSEKKTESEWIEQFLSLSEIDEIEDFKKKGFYCGKDNMRVGLSDFISDPLNNPLATESGKIEIVSKTMKKLGGTLLPEHILIKISEEFPLRMISPHEKYRVHSQNDNIPSLKKLCDDRLWISITDGNKRNIKEGDSVKVLSKEGEITTIAHVTDDICAGTVSLNQGSWASNVNYLTSTEPTKPSMGSRTHSIVVNVYKL